MPGIPAWLSAAFAKPDLASWLQAFAAVVALGISVWATWRVGAIERQRDRLEAHGILPKLRSTVSDIQSALAQQRAVGGNLVGQSVAANIQSFAQLPVPPMIDRNIDRLFMLGGSAGPSCLRLVGMLFQYNTFLEHLVCRMMPMSAEQWTDAVSHLKEHLVRIEKIVEKCENAVRPIHDAIRA